MTFYWFGDSWVYGDELSDNDRHTNTFAKLVSDYYQASCVNLAICGSSVNSVTYELIKNIDKIDPLTDVIFFGLTSNIRTSLFDNDLKNLLPSGYTKHNIHPYVNEWYRYFDTPKQRVYNYDCNINLLYLLCKDRGINCYFFNIFTLLDSHMFNVIPAEKWLIRRTQCIAEYILPVIDITTHGLIMDDCPEITSDQWIQQEVYVKNYIRPCYSHPNVQGHKKIAEELIKCLNYKTKQIYNTNAE